MVAAEVQLSWCGTTADVFLTCRMSEPDAPADAPPESSGPADESATLDAVGEPPMTQAGPAADTVMMDAVEQAPAQHAQAGTGAETAVASEKLEENADRAVACSAGRNRTRSLREINGSPAGTTPKPEARSSSTGATDIEEAQLAKLKQFFRGKYNSEYNFSGWTCTVR